MIEKSRKEAQLKKFLAISLLILLILIVIIAAQSIANSANNSEGEKKADSATENQVPQDEAPQNETKKGVGETEEATQNETEDSETPATETFPKDAETLNETQENETQKIPEAIENETGNEAQTSPEDTETNLTPEQLIQDAPQLDINIDYPKKINRGEEIEINTVIKNSGSNAERVSLDWQLPFGFKILNKEERNCRIIRENYPCISKIVVESPYSTPLGKNEIKLVVNYENE